MLNYLSDNEYPRRSTNKNRWPLFFGISCSFCWRGKDLEHWNSVLKGRSIASPSRVTFTRCQRKKHVLCVLHSVRGRSTFCVSCTVSEEEARFVCFARCQRKCMFYLTFLFAASTIVFCDREAVTWRACFQTPKLFMYVTGENRRRRETEGPRHRFVTSCRHFARPSLLPSLAC